ncbi:MAG: serine O-acetyltransferase [Clostridia bacterium]|nr:serine O-acetyltransferase [Clostridia bacterium]
MKKKNLLERIGGGIQRAERRVAYAILGAEREVRETVQAVRERDPAARNTAEILLLYSGVHAILAHRVAHKLQTNQHYFSARAISQVSRFVTGIEIHPGATIGKNLFIDHGSGVVIGETTEIGDNCTLYQGVTLGGTGKDVGKRHPTLGDNVMVGSGAKVLGPVKVGSNSKIAANAVVLHPVPENSTAVGIPARVVRRDGVKVKNDLDQVHIPDPVAQQLNLMEQRIAALQAQLDALQKGSETATAISPEIPEENRQMQDIKEGNE